MDTMRKMLRIPTPSASNSHQQHSLEQPCWTLPRAAGVLQGKHGVAQHGSDQHRVESTPIRELCGHDAVFARHGEHCSEHRGVHGEAIERGISRRWNISRRGK